MVKIKIKYFSRRESVGLAPTGSQLQGQAVAPGGEEEGGAGGGKEEQHTSCKYLQPKEKNKVSLTITVRKVPYLLPLLTSRNRSKCVGRYPTYRIKNITKKFWWCIHIFSIRYFFIIKSEYGKF